MLKDAPSVLIEMAYGFAWPINAPLDWAIRNWGGKEWIRVFEVAAVAVALAVFVIEFQIDRPRDRANRAEERLARMWGLATDPRPGNSGKIPALEYLHKLGKPLPGISIPKAYLSGVDLQGANLSEANLSEANLSGAALSKAILLDANLSGADLSGTKLIGANLYGANLSGAKLFEANLSEAKLFLANLSGADLSGAEIRGANFYGANLSGANLAYADLSVANLSLADLEEVINLTQAMLDLACIEEGEPPVNLPAGLKPPTNTCPKKEP